MVLFTALYLKQCSSSLQSAYAGVKRKHGLLPTPVSLTRSGFPTINPAYHRHLIYKRDDRGDRLVKIYLSFFSISRLIRLAKKVDSDTFESICTPAPEKLGERLLTGINLQIKPLLYRYCPWLSSIPLNQGISWTPTWKSLPTYRQMTVVLKLKLRKTP